MSCYCNLHTGVSVLKPRLEITKVRRECSKSSQVSACTASSNNDHTGVTAIGSNVILDPADCSLDINNVIGPDGPTAIKLGQTNH